MFQHHGIKGNLVFLLAVLVLAAGCTAHRAGTFKEDLSAKPAIKFAVGYVENKTGETFEVDVPEMYKEALQTALSKEGLLAEVNSGETVKLVTKIVEYKKGSAAKRWLMPGWGSTVFAVQVKLKEANGGKDLGNVEARRSIGFGGLLTVGAWKDIVKDIANDVVKELREKIGQKSS